MAKAKFNRIQRTGRLSPEQVKRDEEIRRRVMHEFPPLEGAPITTVLSEPLREAIVASGKTVRQLAKKAKVSEIVLQQFMDGERDLRLATAERLAQVLRLKLVAS